jgi:septum formation protein
MPPEHDAVVGGSFDVEFFLASASPRRRELLAAQGYRFAVIDASIAEVPEPGESARHYVERMAAGKARAGRAALPAGDRRPVLAADTEVVVDGCILGKPGTLPQEQEMLGLLSGRAHRVLSAVALDDGGSLAVVVTETVVHLRELESAEIRAYWRSGEPCDKAGGYAIQGLAAAFVERIVGSYSGVVGLPLFETARLLQDSGISGWQQDAPDHE